MQFAHARAAYRQTEKAVPLTAADPYQIIMETLRELARALQVLAQAQDQAQPMPPDPLNRGLTAVYILQSSLDFEKGGEIAQDLFQLYEFVRYHLLAAFRGEKNARLHDAAAAMVEILSAWQDIGPDAKAPAA
jgi:flagellar protein FliS